MLAMQRFTDLCTALDRPSAGTQAHAALLVYFSTAAAPDAAWAVQLLLGRWPARLVTQARLRAAAEQASGLPAWLFAACEREAGSLAEAIALVLPLAPSDAPSGTPSGTPSDTPSDAPSNTPSDSPPQAPPDPNALGLASWIENRLLPLRGLPPAELATRLASWLAELQPAGRHLLLKLLGGDFRAGAGSLPLQRALAELAGVPSATMAERLMAYAQAPMPPDAARYRALLQPNESTPDTTSGGHRHRWPRPFIDAPVLAGAAQALGPVADWQLEWRFGGLRAQLVRLETQVGLWSAGDVLINASFPDLVAAAMALPAGTVLEGEIVIWHEGAAEPADFKRLQSRLQSRVQSRVRSRVQSGSQSGSQSGVQSRLQSSPAHPPAQSAVPHRLLADAPAVFIASELLRAPGEDPLASTTALRRQALERLLAPLGPTVRLRPAPLLSAPDWATVAAVRAHARRLRRDGLLLTQHGSPPTGDSASGPRWLWPLEPLTVDAVLLYAQTGTETPAASIPPADSANTAASMTSATPATANITTTEYTVAVWNRAPASAAEVQATVAAIERGEPAPPAHDTATLRLVPIARTASGLDDAARAELDRVVRATTCGRFGPVRSLVPTRVIELGFDAIAASARHAGGVTVHLPRLLRLRPDRDLADAGTLVVLHALLQPVSPPQFGASAL